MVRATFFGIEIGKTGLTVSQNGLDVTGHNIANVDTDGYTRQRIISTAYDPYATIGRALPVDQANVGGGVHVKILDQIRSAYLDKRYRAENTTNSYWQKRTESLTYLESYFDNVNEETSINYSISSFFGAMQTLSTDTVEGAPRTLLQTSGKDMVQQMNSIYEGLVDLQGTQDQAVKVTVDEINRMAAEIVDLNKSIYGYEITGYLANDLKDKRNLLLDNLSTLVDIDYREYSDGKGNVKMEVTIGGEKLVDHDQAWQLGVIDSPNPIDGEATVMQPVWMKNDQSSGLIPDMDKTLTVKGGELRAYLDMRDGDGVGANAKGIPYFIDMLNNLAKSLVQEVNAVHRNGWTDPPVGDSQTGINFFYEDSYWTDQNTGDILTPDPANPGGWLYQDGTAADPATVAPVQVWDPSKITAKNIRLSDEVEESAYNIACSTEKIVKEGNPDELQRGNNENMRAMYNLFLKKDIEVGGVAIGSLDGYATTIRFDVANTLSFAKKSADNSNTLAQSADNQRISVAGVSLDEEMTNLIKYQHAYSGASRVITAMDEALDKLINGTGRVGL